MSQAHEVLCYRKGDVCWGRCSCKATVGPVDNADALSGAIRSHHPLAKWVGHEEAYA